ncbi:Trp biosynthesis-associated membrane protein [Cellulomonas sp. PhB143]|uniref:Trp biosynthesis-associated membrane protein n=1 Tax=Cellulomonas sp. PhB143 TaxID=2485186 RepID=UPI000F46212E|nr:Trp biosynthesis-associated membrane protein [Cellulomonas sp. PhB143]ROS74389.1 tryptophan-associated transmembrane protein [Cellulomonas sp. PhB143]
MSARRRGILPARRGAILGMLLLGVLALLLAMPTWLTTTGTTAIQDTVDVTVTGTTAAPAVGAGALVLLAAALALGLVGRIGRWVVLVVAAAAGVVVLTGALAIALDPEPAARSAAAATTGVTTLTSAVSVSPLPWVVALVGALATVLAVLAGVAAPRWSAGSSRHERAGSAPAAAAGPASSPTSTSAGAAPGDGPAGPGTDVPEEDGEVDLAALWDSMSREGEAGGEAPGGASDDGRTGERPVG